MTEWDRIFAKLKRREQERPPAPPPRRDGPQTCGYFRVSTARQADLGYSLEGQKALITKYAEEKGIAPVLFFVDPGTSASKVPLADREAGGRLVQHVRPGDRVIVPKIDRGFRNFADFVHWYSVWTETGVALHVINLYGQGQMDSSTAAGRLLARTVASFAAFESEMNSERVTEAFAQKRAQGYLVNGFAPPGFRPKRMGKGIVAVPDPDARHLMGQMLAWVEEGQTYQAIAAHLARHKVRCLGPRQVGWVPSQVHKYVTAERRLREAERGVNST